MKMIPEKELNIELLKLIKKGDEKAFQIVFNSYFPALLAFVKEYIPDVEAGKNLVQETFLKFWEKRQTLSDETNVKAFLFQVLKNSALNYLKAQKVKQKYEERLKYRYNEYILNYQALEQIDFDSISFKELVELIEQTIEQLPPRCKRVFEMSRYESLKNREIADLLGISEKAVEGHMSKALKELREQLKKHFPSGVLSMLMTII